MYLINRDPSRLSSLLKFPESEPLTLEFTNYIKSTESLLMGVVFMQHKMLNWLMNDR
jgi:hypothetical protein